MVVAFGVLLLSFLAAVAESQEPTRRPARSPLRADPKNPRYFTDGSGKAVYLTGAHTWANLQDQGRTDPPPQFDFDRYLDFRGDAGQSG